MIRAATPLTILLFAAFALLLISVISVPIIKPITLATYGDVSYGVFGYCVGNQCSPIEIGYNPDTALKDPTRTDFSLPSNARHSLSSLLIIHPIAAAFTLVLMILAACSHLHGPSNNPKYLLGTLLFALPTFLVTLLAFLVDILLFIPHLSWGGWLVLAATICILTAGIMTCAMRRTVVSRAAQKARIAVNAEMNGEAFREQRAAAIAQRDNSDYGSNNINNNNSSTTAIGSSGSPAPMMREPKIPEFATFDVTRKPSTDNDRTPLNPRGQTPQPNDLPAFPNPDRAGGFNPNIPRHPTPGDPENSDYNSALSRQRSNHTVSSDGFGPAASSFDRHGTPPVPMMMGGAGGPGGRGGYPPRGGPMMMRGRGGPGGMGPRGGGFGPPPQQLRGGMRGGPGGMGPRGGPSFRGRGGPNGFYVGGPNGSMNSVEERPYIGPGPPPIFMRPGDQGPDFRGPSPGFESDNMYGPPPRGNEMGFEQGGAYGPPPRRPTIETPPVDQGGPYGPPPRRPTNEIPPPDNNMGYMQAENPRYASPPPLPIEQQQQQNTNNIRYDAYEMDAAPIMTTADPIGLAVGSQQRRTPSPALQSPASKYSQEEYVPPRTAWAASGRETPRQEGPVAELPVELPTQSSPPQPTHPSSPPRPRRSQDYYEDVDPRFESPPNPTAIPAILTPGYTPPPTMALAEYPPDAREERAPPAQREPRSNNNVAYQDPSGSYEELQPGQRSPAMSTSSHFTSISQRGVNPRWQGEGAPSMPARDPRRPRQQDQILASNPDFELPRVGGGVGGVSGGGGGRGRRGGFGY
ncbi:regulator of ime2 [Orbilia blumenaviensis]|uniref:Regulator of ime2 n=1 Tax=Orbilia blumenaviensis TaxID=1796055 RepID=A0AAV9UYS6_9PEZI